MTEGTASHLPLYAKDTLVDSEPTPITVLGIGLHSLRDRPREATAVSRSSSSADLLVRTRPRGRTHPRDDGSPDGDHQTRPYSRHPSPDYRRDRDRSRERDLSEDRTRDSHSTDRDRDRSLGRW